MLNNIYLRFSGIHLSLTDFQDRLYYNMISMLHFFSSKLFFSRSLVLSKITSTDQQDFIRMFEF